MQVIVSYNAAEGGWIGDDITNKGQSPGIPKLERTVFILHHQIVPTKEGLLIVSTTTQAVPAFSFLKQNESWDAWGTRLLTLCNRPLLYHYDAMGALNGENT